MADRIPLVLNTTDKRIEQVQSSDTVYVPKDLSVYSDIRSAHIDDSNALNTGYYARTDFFTGGITGGFFTTSATNSGAIGIATVDPSTNGGCTNFLVLNTSSSSSSKPCVLGQEVNIKSSFAEYEWGARVYLNTLSNSTEEYSVAIGLTEEGSSIYSVVGYDNIVFHYNRFYLGTDWVAYTCEGVNTTATDTDVAVATAWQKLSFKLDRNNNAPRVRFYINNSLVATHTTNIPDSSNLFNKAIIGKTAGTNQRTFYIDYTYFKITYLNRQTRF